MASQLNSPQKPQPVVPMFTLPFRMSSPLLTGSICLCVGLACGFALWAYISNRFRARDILGWYFKRKYSIAEPEFAIKLGRYALILLSAIFSLNGLFMLSVGFGLIRNGARPPAPEMSAESKMLQKYLEENKDTDVRALIEGGRQADWERKHSDPTPNPEVGPIADH